MTFDHAHLAATKFKSAILLATPAQAFPKQPPNQPGEPAANKRPAPTRQRPQPKPNAAIFKSDSSNASSPFAQSSPSQVSVTLPQTAPPTSQVQRDSGVSDDVWNQLQAGRLAAEDRKRRAKEEESRLQRELRKARDAERRAEERARMRAAALERARQQAAADRAMQEKLQRELEAARRREAEVKTARERAVAELRRKQQEEAQRKRNEEEIQRRLERSGSCMMGYRWVKQLGGWRCEGGAHFVSDGQLGHI